MKRPLIGVLETGGTKFVVGVAREGEGLIETKRILCTSPGETMSQVFAAFREAEERHGKLEALGVGSFGPIDIHPASPTYGYITHTPKLAWRNFNLVGSLCSQYPLPVGWDTDVNAAVLAEGLWGNGKGKSSILYLTIGTGIGGGFLHKGKVVHGLTHPEMGHILMARDEKRDPFPGLCPIHQNCLEGLASGPALEARWKTKAQDLPVNHPAWDLEAEYLGKALANFILILSPEIIILGGGVSSVPGLLAKVRREVRDALGRYIRHVKLEEKIDEYVVAPGLGDQSGILGAFALGIEAWREGRTHLKPEL